MGKRSIPMLERKRIAQKLSALSQAENLSSISDGELLDAIAEAVSDKHTAQLLEYEYESTLLRRLSLLIWEA